MVVTLVLAEHQNIIERSHPHVFSLFDINDFLRILDI